MIRSAIRSLGIPVGILLVALCAIQLLVADMIGALTGVSARAIYLSFAIIGWIAGAIIICRLTEMLFWNQLGRSSGRKTPRLLIQITNVLIYCTMGLAMAATLFNIPLTGAIATSSVIGLVIGFAVKSLISDTFSGIALNLDSGFGINDFVQILSRGTATRIQGRVTEINWRSTYILTPENSMMVIPNTVMSESIVLNYSKPDRMGEFEMVVSLDFEVSTDRALRVLSSVIQAAARENDAIWDVKARISEATGNGINYKIKYMLDPAKLAPGKAKHLILGHLLRHLSTTGLALAHPKIDNWTAEPQDYGRFAEAPGSRFRLLNQVQLFAGIDAETLHQLADRIARRNFAAGERLISAGDPGQSMFVMSEGLVSVRIPQGDSELDVAAFSPGDFFGEMSLLTGEPRSATIVAVTDTVAYEIDKTDIEHLLETCPSAAETLSMAAAERRLSSDKARSSKPPEQIEAERTSMAGKILAGMTRFLARKLPKPELAQIGSR
ncbi:MAG: mechanosensitive ion channel family protein [Sphingomonas sp.]|nr:mechanosensitive ion channel family protein [Sphingomonas sp.]